MMEDTYTDPPCSFGYTDKQTILLGLPGAAITFVTIVIVGYVAGRYNLRCISLVCCLLPGILGGALMAYLPADNKAGLLCGNYLTYLTGPSTFLLSDSLVSHSEVLTQ